MKDSISDSFATTLQQINTLGASSFIVISWTLSVQLVQSYYIKRIAVFAAVELTLLCGGVSNKTMTGKIAPTRVW